MTCHSLAYPLYRVLFNFSFPRGAPIYVESLDPEGVFNAWNALTFLFTFE